MCVNLFSNVEVFVVVVVVGCVMIRVRLMQEFLWRRSENVGSRNRSKVVSAVWTSCEPYRCLNDILNGSDFAVSNIRLYFIVIVVTDFGTPKAVDVDFALICVMPTGTVGMV